MRKILLVVLAMVTIFLLPLWSWAFLIPVLDITGGGETFLPLAPAVAGWQFHVTTPLTVAALGVWDEGNLPLYMSHQIGLWTVSETLLGTATVGNTATPVASASPDGQWLFTEIVPIVLSSGDYVLGAVWDSAADPGPDANFFRAGETSSMSFGATFSGDRVKTLLPSRILLFPDESSGLPPDGIFGPNIAVSAVPEPTTMLLLGSGLIGLAGYGRKKFFKK